MIQSLGSEETELIREGIGSSKLPVEIQEIARRKLRMINNSLNIKDLMIPPSNRLEKHKAGMKQIYSIMINDKWSIKFKWIKGHANEVEIIVDH